MQVTEKNRGDMLAVYIEDAEASNLTGEAVNSQLSTRDSPFQVLDLSIYLSGYVSSLFESLYIQAIVSTVPFSKHSSCRPMDIGDAGTLESLVTTDPSSTRLHLWKNLGRGCRQDITSQR